MSIPTSPSAIDPRAPPGVDAFRQGGIAGGPSGARPDRREASANPMERRAFFSAWKLGIALIVPQLLLIFTFFYWPAGQAVFWAFTLQQPWGGGNEWEKSVLARLYFGRAAGGNRNHWCFGGVAVHASHPSAAVPVYSSALGARVARKIGILAGG